MDSSSDNSDKVFSIGTVLNQLIISQHSNRRFRHRTLRLHYQQRQLYKQEEEYGSRTSPLSRRPRTCTSTR